ADAVVTVEHREREEYRARLERAEERGRRLGARRQQHRDAVADLDAMASEDASEAVAGVLQLAPRHRPLVAAEVLPQHRELLGRMLVADVLGDVVAVGDAPLVRGD